MESFGTIFLQVNKSQWITLFAGICLVACIYFFGRTVPPKKTVQPPFPEKQTQTIDITADSILTLAKKQLSPDQVVRLNTLENSISRGDPAVAGQVVKEQQLKVYHQLAHFWSDSAGIFEPYAWYEAQYARLVNSEKSLTFAARLFLDNLQVDEVMERRKWKALQAKDLFERSLKLNPDNDSSRIGLGACYLFGNISVTPMEGIAKIMEVANRDSNNIYAQIMLAKGSLISAQYDKAITRLQRINRLQAGNAEAILMLADVYERTGDKLNAISWYQKSLPFIIRPDVRSEIEKRIEELRK